MSNMTNTANSARINDGPYEVTYNPTAPKSTAWEVWQDGKVIHTAGSRHICYVWVYDEKQAWR